MSVAKFLKDNLVLVVGLTLPVLLMAGFLAVSALLIEPIPRNTTSCSRPRTIHPR
jgi:hypothetical protein